ncbi:alpha/beta hydrolase family protein [Segetibacter sp. 3557_3]|uniref:alpha/beta hydrolase family protein n=1 Tax=Segetibacter sp. 3557_3 TaxID=2547429 RepID=UPI0014048AF2|nr:alpha/beta hydrolase [Segetibacter sp. 3557_3]
MKVHKVRFSNKEGHDLSARITLPDKTGPFVFAIIAHCFTCNKDFNCVRNISKSLALAGFGILSLDYTGLGKSDGNFSESNFSTNVNDLLSAAVYLLENYTSPALIIGHSFGGPAAIYAASQIPSIKAVVTIAAPSEVDHVTHLIKDKIEEINAHGEAAVSVGGNRVMIEKQFLDDIARHNLPDAIKELGKAILIMHSPHDSTVSISNAEQIYTAAKHPKSFVSLDNADHLLSSKKDACYTGDLIAVWARRYINPGL